MIIITGRILLKEENREEAIALGLEHSARSRSEAGCISHDCCIAADDPRLMHFFERWADEDAVRQHFAVPASSRFVREISLLASARPEISIFSARQMGNDLT